MHAGLFDRGIICVYSSHLREFDYDSISSKQPEYLVHLPQDSKQLPAKAAITRDYCSFCYPATSFLFTISSLYIQEAKYTSPLFSGEKRECINVTSLAPVIPS